MINMVTMIIMDYNDDHNTLYLGYEPGDDYDDHIHHSLLPCFDSGDDNRS